MTEHHTTRTKHMLPKHTAVRITDESHEFYGYTGFIYKVKGDEASTGDNVPENWAEVIFDPMDTDGFYTELFHEDDLSVCGC